MYLTSAKSADSVGRSGESQAKKMLTAPTSSTSQQQMFNHRTGTQICTSQMEEHNNEDGRLHKQSQTRLELHICADATRCEHLADLHSSYLECQNRTWGTVVESRLYTPDPRGKTHVVCMHEYIHK